MPQVRLTCLSEKSAASVVAECGRMNGMCEGDAASQDGAHVVLLYTDPQWPVNTAYWAEEHGHATGQASARVINRA